MRKALLIAALVGAAFVATPAQAATPIYCGDQPGDIEILGLVGIDQIRTYGNVIGVCVQGHVAGVGYRSDYGGTCVWVVVDGTYLGCTP